MRSISQVSGQSTLQNCLAYKVNLEVSEEKAHAKFSRGQVEHSQVNLNIVV